MPPRLGMQGHAQKLSHCLLALSQAGSSSNDHKVTEELHRWTSECESLVFFLAVGDLKKLVAFSSSRLDGQMGPAVNQLADSWYRDYLVSRVTAPFPFPKRCESDVRHF